MSRLIGYPNPHRNRQNWLVVVNCIFKDLNFRFHMKPYSADKKLTKFLVIKCFKNLSFQKMPISRKFDVEVSEKFLTGIDVAYIIFQIYFHCTICTSLTFGGTPDASFPGEGLGQSLVLPVCSFHWLIHQLLNRKILLQNL